MKKHEFAIPENVSGGDIKRIRKILGWTQLEFAEYACVSPKTVERWEGGEAPVSGPVVSVICFGVLSGPYSQNLSRNLTAGPFGRICERWNALEISVTDCSKYLSML